MAKGVVLLAEVTLEAELQLQPYHHHHPAPRYDCTVCGGVRVSIHLGLKPNQKLGNLLKVTMRT